MRILKIVLALVLLSGCSDLSKYRSADDKVLCDPETKEAYTVEKGLGATSFIKRMKHMDKLCEYK
jgi:uncharacterized protein YceK